MPGKVVATLLIRGLSNLPPKWTGCVATIGNFDGVHIGHQALIENLKKAAASRNVPSVAVIFEPQPAEFFGGGKSTIPRLTRLREKFHRLSECGVDYVLVLRFNEQFAKINAEQFIQKIIVDALHCQHIIVGDDFRFGKGREGDFAYLQAAGEKYGFTADNMESVLLDGQRVSSTLTRQALLNADHGLVERLLGHPFYLEGQVVAGDKRGRTIGFPTANIYLHRQATPVKGVYVVRMHGIDNEPLPGVANIGTRPTVDGTRIIIEVHLFNFDRDIYRRQVKVEFCEKIRDEKRYENLELLVAQIKQDAEAAKKFFCL